MADRTVKVAVDVVTKQAKAGLTGVSKDLNKVAKEAVEASSKIGKTIGLAAAEVKKFGEAFAKVGTGAKSASIDFKKLKEGQSLKKLAADAEAVEQAAKDMAAAFHKTQLSKELSKSEQAAKRARSELRRTAQQARSLGGAFRGIGRKAAAGMRKVFSASKKAIGGIKSFGSALLSIKTLVAGFVLGKLVGGIQAMTGAFIGSAVEIRNIERTFKAITGSTEAARKEFEWVKQVSNELGTDLRVNADAYKQLAAAAQGTALQGEATRKLFVATSSAMRVLGKSGEDTKGALMALQQMISKGKVSAEELRQQLGERLPGAMGMAAKAMGMTTAEFDKAMSTGKIMAEDFLPKFADALQTRFGDAAKEAANDFDAQMQRIKNSMFLVKGTVGTVLMAAFKPLVDIFAKASTKVDGFIKANQELIASALKPVQSWMMNLFNTIVAFVQSDAFIGYVSRTIEVVLALASVFKGLVAIVVPIGKLLLTALSPLIQIVSALVNVVGKLLQGIGWVINGLMKLMGVTGGNMFSGTMEDDMKGVIDQYKEFNLETDSATESQKKLASAMSDTSKTMSEQEAHTKAVAEIKASERASGQNLPRADFRKQVSVLRGQMLGSASEGHAAPSMSAFNTVLPGAPGGGGASPTAAASLTTPRGPWVGPSGSLSVRAEVEHSITVTDESNNTADRIADAIAPMLEQMRATIALAVQDAVNGTSRSVAADTLNETQALAGAV